MRRRLHLGHVSCWIFPRLCHTAQNGREGNSFVLRSSPSFSGSRKLISRMCLRSLKSYVFITQCKLGLQEFIKVHAEQFGDRGHAINGNVDLSMLNLADIGAVSVDEVSHLSQRQAKRVSPRPHVGAEHESFRRFQYAAVDCRQLARSFIGAAHRLGGRMLRFAHTSMFLMSDTCCSHQFVRCAHMTRPAPHDSERWINPHHRIGRAPKTTHSRALTLLSWGAAVIIANARTRPRESQAIRHFDTGGMTAKHA